LAALRPTESIYRNAQSACSVLPLAARQRTYSAAERCRRVPHRATRLPARLPVAGRVFVVPRGDLRRIGYLRMYRDVLRDRCAARLLSKLEAAMATARRLSATSPAGTDPRPWQAAQGTRKRPPKTPIFPFPLQAEHLMPTRRSLASDPGSRTPITITHFLALVQA
jgi:hypothetical protein